jgi:hypothetical protein
MIKTLAGAMALVGAACALAGCATIVHGTSEQVQIDSTPDGADVVIDDAEQSVTTPVTVKLARRRSHTLVFHKAGYHDATEHLTSSPSGWILGNVIAGGVVGIAIDASDGAARKLSSDRVAVTLAPLPPAANDAPLHALKTVEHLNRSGAQTDNHDSFAPPDRTEGPPLEGFSDE